MITYKTPEEIKILAEGGKRSAEILSILKDLIAPGVSTVLPEEKARLLIEERGDTSAFLNYRPEGAKRDYPAALCVSINDEIVHGVPNENPKVFREGDVVSLDLGLIHGGLITDAAITLGVGKISEENKKLIKATRQALDAGIKAARSGAHIGDIGFAVESVARSYGFTLAEGLSGHGVGYDVHEDPYVPNSGKKGDGPELKEGMVLAIEPMLVVGSGRIVLDKDGFTFRTKDGSTSAHFEHTIAITDDATLILTE